jgi:2-oxoglutarate ferredoxin oxidoreductase subunit gamma
MRKEICISGFGGQGVALAGYILGKGLAIYNGFEAVMTQTYGPEARGGASSANIVVSDEAIDYPFVQQPEILVALSQAGYSKFRPAARHDALILIDDSLVEPLSDDHVYGIPATLLAEELGRRVVANVVMLGFLTAVTGWIQREAMEQAISTTVRPKMASLNLQAFAAGFEYARQNFSPNEGTEESTPVRPGAITPEGRPGLPASKEPAS